MGLDMYFYEALNCEEGDEFKKEIKYFRKHSDLHGWLTNLYHEKGGKKSEFNCIPMELTKEDVNRLLKYAQQTEHEHFSGFFWGESDESQWKETVVLCKQMQKALKKGHKIIYDSWW